MYKGVASFTSLPKSGNKIDDVYCALDTRYLWKWDGTTWISCGRLETETDKELAKNIILSSGQTVQQTIDSLLNDPNVDVNTDEPGRIL
jgi:hypothetical protein